jgi:dihydrofolate reductase
MGTVVSDISISLDGYITGPNDRPSQGLGEGGRVLHDWIFKDPATFPQLMADLRASTGALIMGRRSYENAEGWGDEPPFHLPVFVVTHRPHERVEKRGGTSFTFVTEGLESALQQAQAVAGERNVGVHGGSVARHLLRAGLLDELRLHVVPVLLGAGNQLFQDGELHRIDLELIGADPTPAVVHLHYRTARRGAGEFPAGSS